MSSPRGTRPTRKARPRKVAGGASSNAPNPMPDRRVLDAAIGFLEEWVPAKNDDREHVPPPRVNRSTQASRGAKLHGSEGTPPAAPTPIETRPDPAPGTSQPVPVQERADLQLVRDDWTFLRSVSTLPQRTGVGPDLLRRLVVKELVDNALDAGGSCEYGQTEDGGYFIEDAGPGIDPDRLAEMFSIARPLVSSKALRLPTRGALGNGLRVVAGAILASGGTLRVLTRGKRVTLTPKDDGTTEVTIQDGVRTEGTRVEVKLGEAMPGDEDGDPFAWARTACMIAGRGSRYRGRSSPWWYGADAFFELLQATGDGGVRSLVSDLDGCSGRKAGVVAGPYLGRSAKSLGRSEAADLLNRARQASRPVKPSRLGTVGRLDGYPWYARQRGVYRVEDGGTPAEVPFVVEAWAEPLPSGEEDALTVCVNRTPVTGLVELWRKTDRGKATLAIFGCNGDLVIPISRKTGPLRVLVNVQTPYMPITHEGKAPNLAFVRPPLRDVMAKLARKARRCAPTRVGEGGSQREFIFGALDAATDKVSGGGRHRYNVRQLWYVVRPLLVEHCGSEPDYGYFSQVVQDRENVDGQPLPGIFRDPRGTLYIPHTGEEIPLGTLAVEGYRHRHWTFNKVLYIEKEGFFPLLKDARWPERHDCALLTSKGQATGAARDLLDLLGDVGEQIQFFCVHDADGPGTTIYQALVQATKTRAARKVRIVNLGLEPEEAIAMGLQDEPVPTSKRRIAVAPYVSDEWRDWLQRRRVELNSMTSPQFLTWLDAKMEARGKGKLVPPSDVLKRRLKEETEARLRASITERVLKEAGFEGQVKAAIRRLRRRMDGRTRTLATAIRKAFSSGPSHSWADIVARIAVDLANQ